MSMEKPISYAKENYSRFMDELFEVMRIPSISALSEHAPDMVRCAEALRERLLKADRKSVV